MKHLFKKARIVAALGATALFVMLGSVGAQAAASPGSLAADNQMFGLSCYSGLDGDLYTVALEPTGVLTKIGTDSKVVDCWNAVSQNPLNGLAYGLQQDWDNSVSTLYSINTATGASTSVGVVKASAINVWLSTMAINDDGVAYGFSWDKKIYTLNLATGEATFVANLMMDFSNALDAAAFNPVDGKLYGLNQGANAIYNINLTSGIGTKLANSAYQTAFGGASFSMSFDANGTAWFLVPTNSFTTSEIWSADISNTANTKVKSSSLSVNLGSIFVGTSDSPTPPPAPSVNLSLGVTQGAIVAGSETTILATGLEATAAFEVVVRSEPQTLATGNAIGGEVNTTVTMPSNLGAGWHTLTFSSTAADGSAVTSVLYFEISSTGTLLGTSTTKPATLAQTGFDGLPLTAAALALLILGAGSTVLARRRRTS